ncbi:hypothetical protein RB195_006834 [Necator americanus]|uniref:Uncharacterized protein n=1 Tax=Necator americanus TaxID=51031 RepID=A0ABR1BUE4_NECAM
MYAAKDNRWTKMIAKRRPWICERQAGRPKTRRRDSFVSDFGKTWRRIATTDEESEIINAYVHSSMEAAEISALRKRIRTAKTAIGTEANKLEAAMEKFSETVDRLNNKTQSLPEIIERIETNTTAAQILLYNANKALARLIRLQEELEFNQEQSSLNRNIDNLFKFNYLLDALEGDAEESVSRSREVPTNWGTRRQCFPAKGAACEVLGGCSEAYLAAENAVEERRKLEYGSFALSSKGAYQYRA